MLQVSYHFGPIRSLVKFDENIGIIILQITEKNKKRKLSYL